jgi:hypothetical protein
MIGLALALAIGIAVGGSVGFILGGFAAFWWTRTAEPHEPRDWDGSHGT